LNVLEKYMPPTLSFIIDLAIKLLIEGKFGSCTLEVALEPLSLPNQVPDTRV
jgi:hypothetical protein